MHDPPPKKRRTRAHVIEDLSENCLERMVLLSGHILRRPHRDYGVDVTMFHFDSQGFLENGEVRFQLKATDRLSESSDPAIAIRIDRRDMNHWSLEPFPLILVVFDTKSESAFWLHVQDYAENNQRWKLTAGKTLTVRVPRKNLLSPLSISYFRELSLHNLKLLQTSEVRDVRKRPR